VLVISKLKTTLIASIFVFSCHSFGWGTKGHETIEEVAIELMPANNLSRLLKHNLQEVKFLSMVPDLDWKHGHGYNPLEAQAHFFQIDFYDHGGRLQSDITAYIDRAGGPHTILKQGTAPWRVEQMSWLLVQTMKMKRLSPLEVLQIAATLGHYVGDVGNPLHVATDFDGIQIGQKGLHKFFETETVDEMPDERLLSAVDRAARPLLRELPNALRPIAGAFALAKTADFYSDKILKSAKRLGLTSELKVELKPIIVLTLAQSAAVLAKIWTQAYVLAGSPEFETENLGKVPVPQWVPITYIPGIK
jgi:hypothetical protein